MIDVLLATSYFIKNDPKQQAKMRPYPPLATLIAAAYLRQNGFRVALFDAMLAEGVEDFALLLEQTQPRLVALYEDNFNFLNKMCLSHAREAGQTMVQLARAAGAVVVVAGSDPTDHPEVYLNHGAQAVLIGEPDHTLLEVTKHVVERAELPDWSTISGVVWLKGGTNRSRRMPERHPDIFPLPAWDLIDAEHYRTVWQAAHGYFSLNMASTRGCPFHCNWCAKPIWGQRYAMRSAAHVAEEMALLKGLHAPDHLWFADDIFGLRPSWLVEFGREVAMRDAHIPFMMQSRADLMTEEAVAGLKSAGCIEVWLGAESGSQKILDAMDKGTTVEQIHLARTRLGKAGIQACFFVQLGYPGETWEDIWLTVELIRKTLPDNIGVSVSYPLPGTKFHGMVASELGEKDHWQDSDDLAMMFQGTFPSAIYKKLHRMLHKDLAFHQQQQQLLLQRGNPDGLHSGLHSAEQPPFALKAEKRALDSEWNELKILAQRQRSATPTSLTKVYSQLTTPDLTHAFN